MPFNFEQMESMLVEARRQFDAMRQRLVQIEVEASAGGGMVTVRMNGHKQVLAVTLDPEVVRDQPDMLPDLIRAAVNEAGRKVEEQVRDQLGSLPLLSGLF